MSPSVLHLLAHTARHIHAAGLWAPNDDHDADDLERVRRFVSLGLPALALVIVVWPMLRDRHGLGAAAASLIRPPTLTLIDGTPRQPRAAAITDDEVAAHLAESRRLAELYVDNDATLPDIIRSGGQEIRRILQRWVDDGADAVTVVELHAAIALIEAAGDWRKDLYGDDTMTEVRQQRADLLRRMLAERTAATNSSQIANIQHPDLGIYPAFGIRRVGGRGASSPPMPTTTRQQLGEGIKRLRLARGLKQRELASRVGLTQGHLSEVEAGKREPRGGTIQALIRELRPRNADLASGEPAP